MKNALSLVAGAGCVIAGFALFGKPFAELVWFCGGIFIGAMLRSAAK
jgi:hypothetical protein